MQGLFEGTKAFRREDGRLFLFRPDQNAIRMQFGADRMCMHSPSIDQFVDAVKQTALANRRWVMFSFFTENIHTKQLIGICSGSNIVILNLSRFPLQEKGLFILGLCSLEADLYWVWRQLLNTHSLCLLPLLATISRSDFCPFTFQVF